MLYAELEINISKVVKLELIREELLPMNESIFLKVERWD
jgi:hypothetical protein